MATEGHGKLTGLQTDLVDSKTSWNAKAVYSNEWLK